MPTSGQVCPMEPGTYTVVQMSGTTLADWLRAQDDTVLVALLRARPDLATPVPADTAVLAARIATRASVSRACEDLDTFTLTVLEALLVLDADQRPVPLPDLAKLLGKEVKARPLKQAVTALRGRALLWGPDSALSTPPASRDAVAAFPGGLGRSVPELADPGLDALGEDERRVLETLADGPPIGQTKDAALVVPLAQ